MLIDKNRQPSYNKSDKNLWYIMSWFNYYGLIAVVIIMIPNILCAVFDKTAFENKFNNKPILILEQIGRYGCIIFMTFNIPYTYFGFWFDKALTVYLAVGGILLFIYCLGWLIFRNGRKLVKMLMLSIMPTILFLFCGVMLCSVPLIICVVLFGIGHITVNYKNAR